MTKLKQRVGKQRSATTRPQRRSGDTPSAALPVPLQATGAPRMGTDLRSGDRDAVFAMLGTGPRGLADGEAERRLARDGRNVLAHVRGPSLGRRLAANFVHFMALLLWVGAVVAFAAGLPELGIAIALVNVINGVFSFWQEYNAERATEALQRLLPASARVLRDGREIRVPAEELVVGDVLLLGEGDRISADARLVEAVELRVDESTLTGESRPVRKSSAPFDGRHAGASSAGVAWTETPNLVFAGTSVASGRANGVVHGTGMATEFGRIAQLTQTTTQEQSPLQQELQRLSWVVGMIAVGVGTVFFVLAELLTPMDFATGFVFTLGMIVAFVPEGLLPTVTLSLAMGTQRMARRNALVKRLSAVETLGCTTVICTDKTGTLTQNEMTVRTAWTPTATYDFGGVGYAPNGDIRTRAGEVVDTPPDDLRALLCSGGLANNTRLVPDADDPGRWQVLGDPTEAALKVAAAKAAVDLEAQAAATPRVAELPFDSTRKRMSTLHRTPEGTVAHVKGAPRELLELCAHVRMDGRDVPVTPSLRAATIAANDAMSRDALRVLAVATRRLPQWPLSGADGRDTASDTRAATTSAGVNDEAATVEQGLTLLGLVGMLDPPHPEVADAVAVCRSAGIRTIMMTGDYGLTAESIARRIGLVEGADVRIVNGSDIESMSDAELTAALRGPVIFARATPEHKLRVVTALQQGDEVVAVTGDGVNDAPALKKADIGVAMGRGGTDVAREAADMVLLDDNFASIVNAVEEGRSVYTNIRKFTGYIFTSNTPEAVPFLVFAFSGGAIPLALGVMHILTVDLGTDMVPALALGSEPPEPGVMKDPPRRRDAHLVTRSLLTRSYGLLGPLQSLAVMAAFFLAFWSAGYWGQWTGLPDSGPLYRSATALALAAVVTTQIGNLFAHRARRESIATVGWTTNRLAFVGVASELAIIAAVVYVPFLQRVIGTAAFPAWQWLVVAAMAPLLLIADEIRKARLRRGDHPDAQPGGVRRARRRP